MPTTATLTDRGERALLTNALAPRLFVRLFRNNVPVLPGSLLPDFDVATFPGYADVEITGLWTGAIIDPVGRATSRVFNLTWTRAAGPGTETIYGWVMYQLPAPDSFVIAGASLTAAQVLAAAGETVLLSILAYLLRG